MNTVKGLLLAVGLVWAKSAEDYLHGAFNLYVQGRMQEAGNEVESGLREHPGDAKLASLAGLLKQMKDQQRKDQNQQGGGDSQDPKSQPQPKDNPDQKPSQDSKDSKNGQDAKPDAKDNKPGQQEPKPAPEKPKADSSSADSASSGSDPKDKDKPGADSAQGGAAQKPKPGQMSKEDAERLLNSFDNDEKQNQRDRQAPRRHVDVEEDW